MIRAENNTLQTSSPVTEQSALSISAESNKENHLFHDLGSFVRS